MAYDELFDGLKIRPIYTRQFQNYSRLNVAERAQVIRRAEALVHRDARFLPMVRLITGSEYRQIVAGVKQRGRALRMFLQDYYFGNRSYERAGIFSSAQIEKIKNRYPSSPDQPLLRPENIQFWYAPDVIRDERGNFRVIEDNIGFVGGFGDLEAFADATQILGVPIPKSRHPARFYRGMVSAYCRESLPSGGGQIILLSHPKSHRPNHEDQRLASVLAASGVMEVSDLRSLKVQHDGLFHRGLRVGFVIINRKLDEISAKIPQFWKAVAAGRLGVSYAAGLDFIDDKEICPGVEALVKHYLGEDCLLPSLPTLFFENRNAIKQVTGARQDWVIKRGRGQSGDSVWVGRHLTELAWTRLLGRVAKRPGEFIAQRYCEPSRFLGHEVDLRPLAVITPRGERVSPIPWGRAAKDRKSKTNIARGGLLAPIAVLSRD